MPHPVMAQHRVGKGWIFLASVLLLGIAVLAGGYFSGNRPVLIAGFLVTLGGVLTAVQRILTDTHSWRMRR